LLSAFYVHLRKDLRRRSFVPESVAVPTTHGDDLVSGTGGTDRSSSEQVEAMARAYSENTVARFEEESPKMVDVANHIAEEHTSVTELSNFKAALEDACKSLEDIEFEFQTEQADHDQVHLEASDLIQAAGAKLQEATKIMQEAQKNYDKVNQAASNTIQAADTKLHEAQMSREGKIQDTKRKLLSDLSK
jgi:glucan-binding YG repeat protein